MNVYNRDGTWYCLFEHAGKPVRLSTGVKVGKDKRETRAAAVEAGVEKMKEHIRKQVNKTDKPIIPSQKSDPSIPVRPTLGWALQETWRKEWGKSRSRIVMQHVIRQMQIEVGHWYLDEIDGDKVSEYMTSLLFDEDTNPEGLSPSTVNKRRSYIRKAMNDAVPKALARLPKFPKRLAEKNTKQRFASQKEEKDMLAWLAKQMTDDHVEKRGEWEILSHICVFLVDTGFRFSELFKFSVPQDVHPDIDGKFADLPPDVTKNLEARRVPLTQRAQVAARAILASDWHVKTEDPEVIAKKWDWCSYRFDRCTKATGINTDDTPPKERMTLHILRHTTASRLVQRGVPLAMVKDWMGHKNIQTTMRYAHLAPNSLSGALSALEGKPVVAASQSSPIGCALPEGSGSTVSMHTALAK